MKATIHVNRHVQAANIKYDRDDPVFSIKTYRGTLHARQIEMTRGTFIQDKAHPQSCGATIWMETSFETLIIDGVPANLEMFNQASTPQFV